MDRLDEEKLEMLATWGEGLLADGRDELRAAGRAILLLVEEIERLNVDLWHARTPGPAQAESGDAEAQESDRQLRDTLRRPIEAFRGRRWPAR
jgi:hypothetical protein